MADLVRLPPPTSHRISAACRRRLPLKRGVPASECAKTCKSLAYVPFVASKPQRPHRLPNARNHRNIGREMCIGMLSNGALIGFLERARVGRCSWAFHGIL
eukprot:3096805-Pleurochrysis_carterae.AAC.1